MTYDVLDNERHKAVCELRKMPDGYPSYSAFPFAKWYEDLSTALGIGKGEVSCAKVRDTLIHLLGGDQVPVTLGDPYGIWKGDGDGMDARRRDETGGGRSDAAADGHMADCAGNPLAEGVAPITTELRKWWVIKFPVIDEELHRDFMTIADRIDAVNACLERDNAELREVNERQDEQYADVVHRLDRAYEKNRNQRRQLTEVQEALHKRNEGELKRRWMREKQDLELQIAKMRLESVELPKDADGEVIRVGDKVEYTDEPGVPRAVSSLYLDGEGWWVYVGFTGRRPDKYRHYRSDTWERIIEDALAYKELPTDMDMKLLVARCKKLAGDAE